MGCSGSHEEAAAPKGTPSAKGGKAKEKTPLMAQEMPRMGEPVEAKLEREEKRRKEGEKEGEGEGEGDRAASRAL